MKPEKCPECGHTINQEDWLKHQKKRLRKIGLPSLAKLLSLLNKK